MCGFLCFLIVLFRSKRNKLLLRVYHIYIHRQDLWEIGNIKK